MPPSVLQGVAPEVIRGIHPLAALGLEGANFHSTLPAGDNQAGLGQAQDLPRLSFPGSQAGLMTLKRLPWSSMVATGQGCRPRTWSWTCWAVL